MRFANEDEATRLKLISREKYRRDQEALQEDRWQEGLEEGRLEFAMYLIADTDKGDEEIAEKTKLSIEAITKLRAEMEEKESKD